MISKEWRDTRWKFLLGVVAFLVLLPTVRSYEAIRGDVEYQLKMTQRELRSSEDFAGPMGERERERYLADMRDSVREMRSPGYVEDVARWELLDLGIVRNLVVIVPLAGLLGIGLIAGEVGRGSISLLLSKPVGRTRMLVTKYFVCVACLFVAAVVGGTSVILAAYARGYPPESVDVAGIVSSTALTWLGSLFVLGVALVASVIFRDVLKTLLATVATMFVILAGPDLLRAFMEWVLWGEGVYPMDRREYQSWYETFDYFRLYDYWIGVQPYSGELMVARSLLVCVVTAAAAFLLALWMFRRKTY